MKKSTISKQWSNTTDLYSTNAYKSHRLSMLWLMLLTLLLVPTRMVALTTTEDTRYELFNSLDGISNVTITDNGSYPWQELDLNAEGMENLGFKIPPKSTGLMSSNYNMDRSTSETVVNFTVEKPMLLTFKFIVSSEQLCDNATITLDDKESRKISGMKQIENKALLSVGKHSLKLSYTKNGSGYKNADRTCIYDLKTATTYSEYVADYDATNSTLIFKKITSDNLEGLDLSRMAIVNDGQTMKDMCTNNYSSIKNIIFDESFKTYAPTSLREFFKGCKALETISGLENLNTANVTDMNSMFSGCSALKSLDLKNFNTENVRDMNFMFLKCSALTSLDLKNFKTARVKHMYYMFSGCSALTSLDLKNFNTENVTDMYNMFDGCSDLTSLDLTNFNTTKVTNMSNMFSFCSALTSLDLTNFNTTNVTYMYNMFDGCSALTSLDLTNFNTANVECMQEMFKGCSTLQSIYVSDNFVVTGIKYESYKKNLFTDCKALKGAIPGYNPAMTSSDYANYKTGYFSKLVGKNGEEKIGAAGEPLAANNLTLDDNKDFVAYEPFAVKAASYNRTIKTGNTWATLCLPFEVSLDGQNFRAFKLLSANEGTGTVELDEIETSIEAGTPVIIKMINGATELKFSVTDKAIANEVKTAATADGNYQLQGLYTQKVFDKDADNNCYIVKGDKLMNPAKLLENTKVQKVTSKPFRAYMVDNSSAHAGAKMFCIGISGNSTAIDSLNTIADDNAIYYDLQGKRLNEPQKGINIVKRGGKTMKVIIK